MTNRITGHGPQSLGLHPLVYFYNRSGTFQPVTFFAMARLLESWEKEKLLQPFTRHRGRLEDYLLAHREGPSSIVHRKGSGQRSLPWMIEYLTLVLDGIGKGLDDNAITTAFETMPTWEFMGEKRGPSAASESEAGAAFSRNTKSAAIIDSLKTARRCSLCNGFLHKNSVHIDHAQERASGGTGEFSNAQPAHPYCDSTYKRWSKDKPLDWVSPAFSVPRAQ